jgi:phage terminase large subunit-like protein
VRQEVSERAELYEQLAERIAQRKMFKFRPYGHPDTLCPDGKLWKKMAALKDEDKWVEWSNKPWQLDFINGGATYQERMLKTGNREGKTLTAAAETAIHMTGLYPDYWDGKRFDDEKNLLVWTGSPTNETSRDIIQKELLGGTSNELLGTGLIPKESLKGRPKLKQAGCSDVVDLFKVKRKNGGVATCIMKSYIQGWRKWQGTAPHVVWMDEEPDDNEAEGKIYSEARTRIITSNGILMVTFTPLLGNTALVTRFTDDESGKKLIIEATWDDVPHLNEKKKADAMDGYQSWEIDSRTKGVPMLGEGRIFITPEDSVICDPFEIPSYYTRINGIDFGLDHPFACVKIAIDRDRDIVYVYDDYRKKNEINMAIHATKIKEPHSWIPVSWPHDGAKRNASHNGKETHTLKQKLSVNGVNMLSKSARYNNAAGGAQPTWPIIEEIQERERSGRLKVFSNCRSYLEERRNYHTKDGKIVRVRDDVLSAGFYAVMMLRYARTFKGRKRHRPTVSCMSTRV